MGAGLPGKPIVEHIRNAPSPLMGAGAVLLLVGLPIMMVGSLGDFQKASALTCIGIAGTIMMVSGLLSIVIGYAILERRWKKQGQ